MVGKSFRKLELLGSIFNIFATTFLIFSYKLSNNAVWSIIFASANHSLWEHIKSFFLPFIFWIIIEISLIPKVPFRRLVASKVIALYSFLILNILSFYLLSYLKDINLFESFIIFYLFLIISYLISYIIFCSNLNTEKLFYFSLILLMIFVFMYINFTAKVPKLKIFKDPLSGIYGIIPKKYDTGAIYLNKNTNY